MNDIIELKKIIERYDELVSEWFSGSNASVMAAGGENVFDEALELKEKSLKILEKMLDKHPTV